MKLLGRGGVVLLATGLLLALSTTAANAADDGTAPARLIAGSNTTLTDISGLAVAPDGTLYVSGGLPDALQIFPPGASGNVTPDTLGGPAAGINGSPRGLAVDSAGHIYVADFDHILVFAAGATGNATPIRRIAGPNTGLSDDESIAVDSDGRIYAVDLMAQSIAVFAPDANGDTAPLRTIQGPSTRLFQAAGIQVAPNGDVYVISHYLEPSVLVFAADANGNAAPIRVIGGPSTNLDLPFYLALGSAGQVFVADFNGNAVNVFAPDADGNVAPVRVLRGPATDLALPDPIAVDPAGDLFVGNFDSNTVTVYNTRLPVTAVSPASGPATGGTVITITGSGFTSGSTTVTVGGVAATDVVVESPTVIHATVPAHTKGAATVQVLSSGFDGSLADGFDYTAVAAPAGTAPTLAFTGSDATPTLAAGLVLLLAGGILLVAVRRRRQVDPLQ